MQALVFDGPGDIHIKEVDKPRISPDEVLIKTGFAAVCGTDLHIMKGSFPAKPGIIMGHEAAGTVEAVGENVKHLVPGQQVVNAPYLICGDCLPCRSGRYNVCRYREHLGIDTDGVFAEYYKLPEYAVYPSPDGLSLEEGALVEPAAVGYHAVRRIAPTPSDTVVIIGAGPIGLFALESVVAFGSQRIIVSGHRQRRLELAKRLGAHRVVRPPEEDLRTVVLEETDGNGADMVIEAAGRPDTIAETVSLVRSAGRICLVGIPSQEVRFDFISLVRREVDVLTSDASLLAYERTHELVAKRILDARPLISHVFPFERIIEAIEASQDQDAIKILIRFGEEGDQ